jgi:hypothetical protein
MLSKCTVQEEKPPVKNLVRQGCAEGFNPGFKGLNIGHKITGVPYTGRALSYATKASFHIPVLCIYNCSIRINTTSWKSAAK